ncbi:hypothetical protein [Desulfopila sp. IMCC35008]|uniref:hypothetical protein n=1 Tax=Desulfopila sp. IMCC35008 TaxID=2653858 RepID=UPI00142ED68C|nr:hypothetical protein [Desulfopila sp. IMCC35008]
MPASPASDYYDDTANATMAANSVQVTTEDSGGNQPHAIMQPFITVNFIIALQGTYPPRN